LEYLEDRTVPTASLSVVNAGPVSGVVTAGTPISYTITLTNNGPDAANSVVLTDQPDFSGGGVVAGSGTITPQPSNLDSFSLTINPDSVSATANGALANGSVDTFLVTWNIDPSAADGSVVTNTASASSSSPDVNPGQPASVTTTVAQSADLAVTKTGPTTITAGTTVTYSITVTNNGPSDAQTVQLTDTLASGLTLLSEKQTGGTDSFSDNSSPTTNTITFNAATMAANSSDVFEVVAGAASSLADGLPIDDTASVFSNTNDPNPDNNNADSPGTVAVVSDLEVANNGPATITAGSTVTYTLTLTNNGPSDAQFNVTLNDSLPNGLTPTSASQTGGSDNFGPGMVAGNTATFSATTVAAGNTDTFEVVAVADPGLTQGTQLDATASVSSVTANSNPNPSATFTSTVAAVAGLVVTKTGPDTITAGGAAFTYTISLANNGISDAQNVTLTDALPAGLTLDFETQTNGSDPFTDNTGQPGTPSNTVTFSSSLVTAGNSDTFIVVASAATSLANGSTISNTASVTSPTTDSNPNNRSSTFTSKVAVVADLSVTDKGPPTATEGDTFTYTLTLTNAGPDAAASVVLSDALPAGLALLSVRQTDGTDAFTNTSSGNTASFSAATVPAGHSDTFEVVVQAVEDGTLISTASVSTAVTNSSPHHAATVSTAVAEGAITLTPAAVSTTEFTALNNAVVATFTHLNGFEPASAFTATINWGDSSTSTGVVQQSGATYSVLGSQTYGLDGSYTMTVTVSDDGVSASGSAAASVGEAPLPAGASGDAREQFIEETMEQKFLQPLSLAQLQGLELGMVFAEFGAANLIFRIGNSPTFALNVAQSLIQQEFGMLVSQLAAGTSQASAATNLEVTLLLEGLIFFTS
jgi:uncharacterized repeat protein (TIGR01451 family)